MRERERVRRAATGFWTRARGRRGRLRGLRWHVVLLLAILLVAVVGASNAPADTLFADGFESGDFSAWTLVKTGGDGSATVQSSIVKSGSYAARLSETSTSGSLAYVRKTLASPQVDLAVSGDFQVLQEGASGGNVPLIRLFTGGGTRIISLYRQNVNSKIQVGYGGGTFASSATLALNTWANLQLHVIIAGATSTVEVRLNGNLVYSTSANLGTTAAAILQIGNETAAQTFTLVADNIAAQTSNTGPPVNTSPPTISGSNQQGQTLTGSQGSWSGAQPISYAYQWQRCDSSGANCGNIASATSTTYTLTSADVGSTLVLSVTATNPAGSQTAASAATAAVWTSSPVALWHMDETSGSTTFDSVGQNNGTPHSVTLGRAGFSGLAYGFNGSTSYVSVPSAGSMNPGSANFSFTIHLQTTGTPPPPPEDWDLIRKGDYPTPGGEYKMEYQESGQASCGFKGSAHYAEIIAGPALNDGQWHTITCVKTSSDIELIVDGQAYSQAANIGSIANTDPVIIGSHPGADWYQGSLDEASIRIQAGNVPLTSDFTASPTSGTAPLAVSFTDVSTGGPTAWSWNFGDGGTSTQQNPTHTYSTAGTYSVSLTVSNATGSATASKTNYIVVTVPLTADFAASPTSGTAPLAVSFTDVSTGGPTSWSWNFGDGNTSTQQNPTHTYSTAGTYSVSLTVSNATGSANASKTNYIVVAVPLTTDFAASPTSGTAPLAVSFTDVSTGGPTSWSWNFGDGNTSTQQNPTHTYSTAGTYSVSLTVSNATGSANASKTNYIVVAVPLTT